MATIIGTAMVCHGLLLIGNAACRWRRGQTGVPYIDANMRMLLATGYMSNRCASAQVLRTSVLRVVRVLFRVLLRVLLRMMCCVLRVLCVLYVVACGVCG